MQWYIWALIIIIGIIPCSVILYFLIMGIYSLFISGKKQYTTQGKFAWNILNFGIDFIACFLLGMRVKVIGKEKLPNGNFLLVSNHRSDYDPIATFHGFKKEKIAFITKPENLKIPIIGKIIRRFCCLGIDRKDPKQAIKTINLASNLIKESKINVGVYPEGTRSKDLSLLDFHDGVFKIAQKADVPVVVAVIKNTEKVKHNFFRRRTFVTIEIVDVIGEDIVSTSSSHDLSAIVREKIQSVL